MEGHCSTGQSPQWAVVPMEDEGSIKLAFVSLTETDIVLFVVCFYTCL